MASFSSYFSDPNPSLAQSGFSSGFQALPDVPTQWQKPQWETTPFSPNNSSTNGTAVWENREGYGYGGKSIFDPYGFRTQGVSSSDSTQSKSRFDVNKAIQAVAKSAQRLSGGQEQQQQQQWDSGLAVAGGSSQDLGGGLFAVNPTIVSQQGSSSSGPSTGSKVIGGVLAGAGAGAAFGPWGAGVGAALGGLGGLFG